MQFNIDTEHQTKKIAEKLGPFLQSGDVIFLIGDLGAGKTTFARALIQSMSKMDQNVPSPTFTLVQSYDFAPVSLDHYDLYRLEGENNEDDIIELGWEDSLNNGITLVEWPDRLGDLTPNARLEISIIINKDESRTIRLKPFGSWQNRDLQIERL
jgi:tRNA threonylcarbamoyladenosine biosynthesis protein TsaE